MPVNYDDERTRKLIDALKSLAEDFQVDLSLYWKRRPGVVRYAIALVKQGANPHAKPLTSKQSLLDLIIREAVRGVKDYSDSITELVKKYGLDLNYVYSYNNGGVKNKVKDAFSYLLSTQTSFYENQKLVFLLLELGARNPEAIKQLQSYLLTPEDKARYDKMMAVNEEKMRDDLNPWSLAKTTPVSTPSFLSSSSFLFVHSPTSSQLSPSDFSSTPSPVVMTPVSTSSPLLFSPSCSESPTEEQEQRVNKRFSIGS